METIKKTIAENMGGPAHTVIGKEHQFDIQKDVPDLSGKVAVVTGGSEGIGYAATAVMLQHNLEKVFVISMSEDVKNEALQAINDDIGAEAAKKVVWLQCDVSDLVRVTEAAKEISQQTDHLDILILNAARGIMTYQLTDYGVDRHMAANHIGHVALTSHLLPLIKKTAKKSTVRIQLQSSNAHEMAPKDLKFASLDELNQDLGPNTLYGRSKLANLLYARYLARHFKESGESNILVNATHPGFVETKMSTKDIHEPFPVAGYAMSLAMKPLKKDQWDGATSTLYAATVTKNSGEYVCPPVIPEPGSELARNEQLGEQLMKLTREIVREKFGKESVEKGCPLKDF